MSEQAKQRAARVRRGDVYAGKTPVNVVMKFSDISEALEWAKEEKLELYEAKESDTRTVVSFVGRRQGQMSEGRKGPVVVETKQVIGVNGQGGTTA